MTFLHHILQINILVFILYLLIPIIETTKLLYPVSFGVVRSSAINVNFKTYMKNIGYPDIDENGNNIGYNIVSLDGYQTGTSVTSVNNDLTPLATWINVYSRVFGNAKNLYGKTSTEVQNYIKK